MGHSLLTPDTDVIKPKGGKIKDKLLNALAATQLTLKTEGFLNFLLI